ncbi:hypothetical protein [Burkholderia guangdongensis]|uniref:hypothetical protein n=1 Tax=Burkholderia guangdongensis TaxID=1792500 RepID=UPI0015CE0B32|nr:hypothetical protein [Burkholderia guangdongensis]
MSPIGQDTFFGRLIALIRRQLEWIARASEGDHSVDDLTNEVWILADEMRVERGAELDPEDEDLRDTIVDTLRKRFGRFVNRKERFATRIDQDDVDDDGDFMANAVAARLAAPEQYEPHVALERREEAGEAARVLGGRFSEAVAYLRVLDHFDGCRLTLAKFFAIDPRTLDARVSRAALLERLQPSMFDGIESITSDFMPRPGVRRRPRRRCRYGWMHVLMRPWQTGLLR